MLDPFQNYIILFGIVVLIGQLFNKSTVPISLLLVITGIILSNFPGIPVVTLNPDIVLNIFLPLLIYQICSFSSWRDIEKNIRPIALLSVGHVIFMACVVAFVIHALIPELGWPLAFVLGTVISPPDDVAIVSIAEKVKMPERVVTILEGEAMFNDATALVLFRFALAAVITHEFFVAQAFMHFIAALAGEFFYGLLVGYCMGEIRLRISNPKLHMIASILTPFIAYIPAEKLGASGVLATAVAGFMIGHRYSIRFTPEFRLFSRALWPSLTFAIQAILFLLVGLDMRMIIESISAIPFSLLMFYSTSIVLTVIIGRFVWVYGALVYLPRIFFSSVRKKDPYPPWQYPFIISWAGMRGAISLAAALAVPTLPMIGTLDPRNLLIFLVFCVITVTFIVQGLTLPWLIKFFGMQSYGQREHYNEHIEELKARLQMVRAVLRWLSDYKEQVKDDEKLYHEAKIHYQEYKMLRKRLKERIAGHDGSILHDEQAEWVDEIAFDLQVIEVERSELLRLWQEEKINLAVRNKLIERLDHRVKNISE